MGSIKPNSIFILLLNNIESDPTSYKEAAKHSLWTKFEALLVENTLLLVEPLKSQHILEFRWFYKAKLNSDDTIA